MFLVLTDVDVEIIREYLDELDALIEEDDGTVFTGPLLTKHEQIKEVFNETS